MLGSLSLVTGKTMRMDSILPDWLERGVEASLRETPEDVRPVVPAVPIVLSSAQQRAKGTASPLALTPGSASSPIGPGARNGGTKGPWTNLDKFYEDTTEEIESEEESEDDEEGEDEEEDGEESYEEDEGHSTGGEEDASEDEEEETTSHNAPNAASSVPVSEAHLNSSS